MWGNLSGYHMRWDNQQNGALQKPMQTIEIVWNSWQINKKSFTIINHIDNLTGTRDLRIFKGSNWRSNTEAAGAEARRKRSRSGVATSHSHGSHGPSRNRWFTMVYLLIAWWISMAMLNNQMLCKKNLCRSYFPLNHSHASITWVFLRYVGLPIFSWPNLTALPQSSTWIYVKLLPRLKVPCGCPLLPFPALTLQGGGTPINANLAGCFESAGGGKMTRKHLGHVYEKGTQAMPAGTWATLMEVLYCFFKQKNSNQPFHQNQP